MSPYWAAFAWGVVMVLAMVGWGTIVKTLLFRASIVDWGLKAAWGLAITIVIGGILNLAGVVSSELLSAYLYAGFGALILSLAGGAIPWIRSAVRHGRVRWRGVLLAVGLVLVLAVALLRYGGSVSAGTLNAHDDYHAYAVFPLKMLQTGSLGPDPYSERRIIGSLGGQSFLHALALSRLDIQNLPIVDLGLGFLIGFGVLAGLTRDPKYLGWAVLPVLILFVLVRAPLSNISGLLIPLALLLAMFRTLGRLDSLSNHVVPKAFIVGILVASIVADKTTYVPIAAGMVLISYASHTRNSEKRWKAMLETGLMGAVAIAALLPWMIAMNESSGTPFFPFLGLGYHVAAYGVFGTSTDMSGLAALFATWQMFTIFALLSAMVVLVWTDPTARKSRAAEASFVAAGLIGVAVIAVGTGGYAVDRHAFPVFAGVALTFLAAHVHQFRFIRRPPLRPVAMAIVSLGVAVQMIVVIAQDGAAWQRAWLTTAQEAMDGPEGLFLENVFEKDIDQYERMQAAIPAGEPFIARMSKPFLLDFNRNLVYVIGYPGMSSPRPGMPISEGGEALSDYLLDQSVRYVAYSQFDEAGFQRRWYGDRVYGDSPWERTEARLAYDFHANVWELAASRKRIYDDGEIFVLDLAQPADSFELPD